MSTDHQNPPSDFQSPILDSSPQTDVWATVQQGRNPPASDAIDATFVGGKQGTGSGNAIPASQPVKNLSDTPAKDKRTGNRRSLASRRKSNINIELPVGNDRYSDLEEIGRGGCGIVYRAMDQQLKRHVVIKQIRPEACNSETRKRFLNEARITGQLSHPGIVPVYEIGKDLSGDSPFYAMKLLEGETLATTLDCFYRQPKGIERAKQFRGLLERFHQICLTLAYAHRMGVVHRDLKPSNIMIGQFGETIVLDWGLAKKIHDRTEVEEFERQPGIDSTSNNLDSNRIQQTEMGAILGTAAYMSPEQARGESDRITFASDVFSLGAILYEMLCGKSPFRSPSLNQMLEKVAIAEFDPVRTIHRNIPKALEAICHRALKLNPEDRYANANELAEDINNYLVGMSVTAYREPWWAKFDRIAEKHRTVFRSIFAAMFVVAIVSIISTGSVLRSLESETMAKFDAEKKARERQLALIQLQQAHDETLRQYQAARKAVDSWLIDLSGSLQFFRGLEPLRKQLLTRAESYYMHTMTTADENPQFLMESARASLRLGDVLRLQGNHNSASTQYQKAESLLIALDENQLDACDVMIQRANALIGQSLCNDSNVAEADENDFAENATKFAEGAFKLWPTNHEVRNTLGRALRVQARVSASRDSVDQACNQIQLALSSTLPLLLERDEERDFSLILGLLEEGAAYANQCSRIAEALEWNMESLRLLNQRLELHQRSDWLDARAQAQIRIGNCLLKLHRKEDAISAYADAEQDLHHAWEFTRGDAFYRENLAIVDANRGHAFIQLTDSKSAEKSLRYAIDSLQWLVRNQGACLDRIERIADCFLLLAEAIQDQDTEERDSLLRDAGRLIEHLSQQPVRPIEKTDHRVLKLRQLRLQAARQFEQGNHSAAILTCQNALSIFTDLKEFESNRELLLEIRTELESLIIQAHRLSSN